MPSESALCNEKIEFYSNMVRQFAENSNDTDEAGLIKLIGMIQNTYHFADDDAQKILKKVQSMMAIFLDDGVSLKYSEHKSWYFNRKMELKMLFTSRNEKYLNEKLSSKVTSTLSKVTDEIMDLFGDPRSEGAFQRRGLIIGDVQSGKTNTYTTLCCKAADTGYEVIILLTGTLESLRRQTQARLDEGFVGCDSSGLLKKNKANQQIGVGKFDPSVAATVFTSTEEDFKEKIMNNLNLRISGTSDTILLVVKKNARILDNLYQWLERKNAHNGIIDSTLLLIDDEADNASINTSRDNVTAINSKLREILKLFSKATYVGFTATPFANIFIDPETEDEMYGDDLFPKHFIYSLNSPSNHIGPTSLFDNKGEYSNMIRIIDDAEASIPEKHTKIYKIDMLPESLYSALNCYILSCAVRDLRGDSRKHMSMLINVSRFTDVQEGLKELVQEEFDKILKSVTAYCCLPESESLRDPHISKLKAAWDAEYCALGFEWADIQPILSKSVKPIQIRSINQRNGVKNLNYNEYPDGLRLIAIGGNSLSRGLTLEGLSISYFYRKSQTYDTLMQMGRWFGYRDGYSDLCRVWMTELSRDWYSYISDATEELKSEIEVMRDRNKDPESFGLRVRNDVRGLLVTARSKMRSAADREIIKTLSGSLIDTHSLFVDKENVNYNYYSIHKIIQDIEYGVVKGEKTERRNIIWRGVPKRYVLDILSDYKSPDYNIEFDTGGLVEFIKADRGNLDEWDIVAQHGESESFEHFGAHSITRALRQKYSIDGNVARLSRRQLSSPDNTKEGLSKDEVELLEKKFREKKPDKQPPAKTYLDKPDRKPLLLIYPIDLCPSNEGDEVDGRKEIISALEGIPPMGLAAGFPNIEGKDELRIRYKTNRVYQKLGDPDLDEDWEE